MKRAKRTVKGSRVRVMVRPPVEVVAELRGIAEGKGVSLGSMLEEWIIRLLRIYHKQKAQVQDKAPTHARIRTRKPKEIDVKDVDD